MKAWNIIAASALLMASAPGGAADLSRLAWMAGSWGTGAPGPAADWTVEGWAPARGGVMLGTSLSGRGDKATSYEFMRIAMDEKGEIQFWGSEGGSTPVPFRLLSASEREAVFVNPNHDYPQRIVYRRTGWGMVATISGADGANPMSWRYRKRSR
jgi:hypothetical protein